MFAVCSLTVLYLLLTRLQLKELTNVKKSYIECYKMTGLKENLLLCKCQHIRMYVRYFEYSFKVLPTSKILKMQQMRLRRVTHLILKML